ncbi:MAG TPA: UvrD-helicase domain-containing protein [Rhodanobacteraceae bacterium]|nr:UvrD-helicase domain-containing protein [Rhodanobacteraceae bacterium]
MIRLTDLAATDLALSLLLDGMQLIEASAGTGKTYTIAGLYARLIVERQLPVRKVLVMTFTKAATEELRQRLRERLALCARLAATPAADPDAPEPDAADGEDAWALALLRRASRDNNEPPAAIAERLRLAVTGMDEAAIFTIHGFCQRVLDAHAALLDGAVAGAELVPSDRDLLEDFAADFWLRMAGEGGADQLAALAQLASTPEALAGVLLGLVTFDGTIEPAAGEVPNAADEQAAWQDLLTAWQADGEAAMASFEEWFAAGYLNGNQYKKGSDARLRQLAAMLAAQQKPASGDLARFGQVKLGKAVNKARPAFPRHDAFIAIDTWLAESEAVDARRRALQPALLQQAVAEARSWLAARKHDLARLSYDDLIVRLATSLAGEGARGDRLAAALRMQYPCALVDEFQDTDPRQFAILDKLYRGHGSLYMIGDPKQAIYGFRGGDVHAYLRAAKTVDGHHHLDRNFRSSAGMLRAVEALFGVNENPFIEDGIAFEHVAWGGRVADDALQMDGQTLTPLTLWQPPRNDDGKRFSADDWREAAANACAATIVRLLRRATLDGQPLQPVRVAVLTNKNAEAALVQDTLHAHGVPAVCLRQESIYASREAAELLRLLDALLVPQSMPRARAALATELLGRTLTDLARMDADEAVWRETLEELADLNERWFTRGIQAMLERLAERHAPRLLALPDGDRRLSNLLQLGEILQADGHRLAGERALRDALAQHIRDADNRNEAEQLRLESDAECVQIVTLHRSKGLEYDVVLMPFAALMKTRAASKGSLATFHRGDVAVKRLIRPDKDAREAADTEACAAAEREALAEDVRKLYVGVTRARYACWISCGGGSALGHLLGDAVDGKALAAAHPDVIACQPLPEGDAESLPATPATEQASARTFTRDLPRDWWIHSFSQLAAGARDEVALAGSAADESIDAAVEEVEPPPAAIEIPAWPRGARYGNAVHAILEQTDFADWRDATDMPATAKPLMTRELGAAGYAGEEQVSAQAATARLVAAALNVQVVDGLRLADLKAEDRRAEMEFHFGIAGVDPATLLALLHEHGYQRQHQDFARMGNRLRGLMTGIIDLVFRHAGQWWIVDYKTNYLGPHAADYQPKRLPAAIAEHDYDLQYLIYGVALHRWLSLSLGKDYDYARDFGGIRYLFLRGMCADAPGCGVFVDRPPQALIEALDALLHAPQGGAA